MREREKNRRTIDEFQGTYLGSARQQRPADVEFSQCTNTMLP